MRRSSETSISSLQTYMVDPRVRLRRSCTPPSSSPGRRWTRPFASICPLRQPSGRHSPIVTKHLADVFQLRPVVLLRAWCVGELVLLTAPQAGQRTYYTPPSQLRPICLLPPMAKVTATALAVRLGPYVAIQCATVCVHGGSLITTGGRAVERGNCSLCGGAAPCGTIHARLLLKGKEGKHRGSTSVISGCVKGV